jgi:ribosomal subunit interface protein
MATEAQIVVTGRHFDLSEHLKSYVSTKLAHLGHFSRNAIRYEVELDHEQNPRQSKSSQRVAITARGKGSAVRAEARGAELHAVLGTAVGRLEGQLRRSHDRRRGHRCRPQRTVAQPRRT